VSVFLSELRKRGVFRVGVAYGVIAWLLAQVADIVLDAFPAPDWVMRAILLMLALGFPLALLLAWAFEMTPEGIKREQDVERNAPRGRRHLGALSIVVLTLAVALFVLDRFVWTAGGPAPGVDRRSVAVIPFENLSGDDANVPFTSGVHDDLLMQLSKIGAIKTISRRSVLQYRDTTKTVPEIASDLQVATILAGGVQRSGDRVRINVRLIDAATDEPLWAETYDRQLSASNIFAIQSEIARSIAEALRATLTAGEQQRLAAVPTRNLEALDSYFLGKQLLEERTLRSLQAAVAYFEKVVELDPDFARAWLVLGWMCWQIVMEDWQDDTELYWAFSREAFTRAAALDPLDPIALMELASVRATGGDITGAGDALERALDLGRNQADLTIAASNYVATLLDDPGRAKQLLDKGLGMLIRIPRWHHLSGMRVSYFAQDFEAAINHARLSPDNLPTRLFELLSLAQLGRRDEVHERARAFKARHPKFEPEAFMRVHPITADGAKRLFREGCDKAGLD